MQKTWYFEVVFESSPIFNNHLLKINLLPALCSQQRAFQYETLGNSL